MLIISPCRYDNEDTIYFTSLNNEFVARMNVLDSRIVVEHNIPCCGSFVFDKKPGRHAKRDAIKTIEHILNLEVA